MDRFITISSMSTDFHYSICMNTQQFLYTLINTISLRNIGVSSNIQTSVSLPTFLFSFVLYMFTRESAFWVCVFLKITELLTSNNNLINMQWNPHLMFLNFKFSFIS
jgi:hypothetical protein